MNNKKDYYKILDLSTDDKNLTSDEFNKKLKTNYRLLCKKFHPDKNPDNKEAEERFKEVSDAYENLSDPEKKAKYDQFGHSRPFHHQRHETYSYTNRQQTRVGENMNLLLKLTLEEIFTGVKKRYKYTKNTKCNTCDGHGGTNPHTCTTCGGGGMVTQTINTPIGQFTQVFPCHVCDGIGLTYDNQCQTCNSSGLISSEETIEVDAPSGVQEGMTFVMKGKGHAIKNGTDGDLLINVMELPHKQYSRNGSDLKMNLKLTYSQLVLGDKIEVETIEGGKIRVTIPEHSDVGSTLRIQNKGLKSFNNDNRGDILVNLGISIPKQISETTKDLLIKLKDSI